MNRPRLIKALTAAALLALSAWAFRAYLDPAALVAFVNSQLLCE